MIMSLSFSYNQAFAQLASKNKVRKKCFTVNFVVKLLEFFVGKNFHIES